MIPCEGELPDPTPAPVTYSPGSHVAKRHGCTCSALRNHFGLGAYMTTAGDVQYDIDWTCPMHAIHAASAK